MLSQRKGCSLGMAVLSLVLIISTGYLISFPAYGADLPPGDGVPGQRVGGGTRASDF